MYTNVWDADNSVRGDKYELGGKAQSLRPGVYTWGKWPKNSISKDNCILKYVYIKIFLTRYNLSVSACLNFRRHIIL